LPRELVSLEPKKARDADLDLRVFNEAGAAHVEDSPRFDRNRPGVGFVHRTVPGLDDLPARIDLEGPQVDLLGRLAVRGEEPAPQQDDPSAFRLQAGFLQELRTGTRGDPRLSPISGLKAPRDRLDEQQAVTANTHR